VFSPSVSPRRGRTIEGKNNEKKKEKKKKERKIKLKYAQNKKTM
jgi:hypothetical protein